MSAQSRPTVARASAPAAAPSREQARAMMTELQTIATRLQTIHARAMSTGDLAATQTALMRDIKTAMERQDPQLPQLATRVKAMEAEARTAQERKDAPRMQALAREFATIQGRFMRAQQSVMKQPAIAARARAFDDRLHRQMVAADPQTDQLLARSRQLQASLQRAAGVSRPAGARQVQ
jgi:cell division protein FtsB